MENLKPIVGQYTKPIDNIGSCLIVAVHGAGTIDVLAPNGKYYRITGLAY